MVCPLCQERKSRRFCPALQQEICPRCCGSKRQVEIRCPDGCPYLTASRQHPPAVVGRQQARDVEFLAPELRDLQPHQADLVLNVLTFLSGQRGDGFLRTTDEDVADAVASVASTLETASRGVIFEHRPAALSAERLARRLREELPALQGTRRPASDADVAAALRKVEKLAREARKVFPGGETACLELAERLAKQIGGPEQEPSELTEPRIIVP